MKRAAGLIGLAALLLCGAGAAWSQPIDQKSEPGPPDALANATLKPGETLPGWIPSRSDVRLGTPRRYAGLYFRTFEGSHFQPDTRPGVPFRPDDKGAFVLALDKSTGGRGLVRGYRRDQPFETNYVEFVGRQAFGKDGKPILSNLSPVIWVDQFVRVQRVADAKVKTLDAAGNVISGWFCRSDSPQSGKCR